MNRPSALAKATALSVLLALSGCAESTGSSGTPSGGGTGEILVGAVLDVTGAGASLGVPERQALEMLAEQLNAAGGINGRKVKLLIEDNQSTEDGAAKAATKLLSSDKVSILLGASRTGPSLAMKSLAETAKIPMISLAASAKIVEGASWVFKTAQNDRVVQERLVEDMAAKGFKKLAIVRDSSGYGEGVAETITELGKASGLDVVTVQKFDPTATDFTSQMVNVRAAAPDVVLIWGIPPAAALAQVAYRQLGPKVPVYQSHGIGNKAFLDAAGASANGVLVPLGRIAVADQIADSDPQKAVISAFVADFKAKYGAAPSGFAGYAHDAFKIATEALKTAGTDAEKLRAAIESISGWAGVSGVFTMTPQNHSGLSKDAVVMVEVVDGQWKLAKGATG